MLESQLPSFNRPPTKPAKGRPEPASDATRPGPSGTETPPGDLAQQESTDDIPAADSVEEGVDCSATLDPNAPPSGELPPATDPDLTEAPAPSSSATEPVAPSSTPSTERVSGGSAPPPEFYGTLQLPDGVSENPSHIADRIATPGDSPSGASTEVPPSQVIPLEPPSNAPRTEMAPPGQRATTLIPLPSVPGYQILGELGRGGMGVVYKARQRGLNRLVALKMIRKDRATDEAVARFQDEAKAVARLRHPGIVQIYDIGEHDGQPYFSLEYIDGGSLDRHIKGNAQLPRASAKLVQSLARAMQVAHEQNIVHRDLKPGNVLVQVAPGAEPAPGESVDDQQRIDPDKLLPKITDFGLAKQLDSEDLGQTHSGAVLGTPYYMAPEQAEGLLREIKPHTDVYALGAILYELLTGRPPFKGATLVETLDQVRHLDPVPPRVLQPNVPKDLETICLKCLQKAPAARYAAGGELAEDLQRYLDDRPILARPINWRERAVKWAKRSPMAAAALGVTVLLVLSLIGTLFVLMQVARKDLEQQRRMDQARSQYETRMSEANAKAQEAIRTNNTDTWKEARAAVNSAYAILDTQELADQEGLRERADRLYRQADAEVQGAQERAAKREQAVKNLAALRDHHDTALVHSVLYTGLTGDQNYDAVEGQLKLALKLYDINPAEPAPPALDPDFYTPEQRQQVLDWYYGMLLFQAEAAFLRASAEAEEQRARLRRALGVGVGGPAHSAPCDDNLRLSVRQVLEKLNRADRFRAGDAARTDPPATNASLQLRVRYLEALGEAEAPDLKRAREQLAATPPASALDLFLAARARFMARADTEKEAQALREDVMKLVGRALQLDADYFGARYLMTICQLQEGNLQVARDQLTSYLKERPTFIWLQLLRGFVWMQMGDLPRAEEDFNAARNHPNAKIRYVALVNSSALSTRSQKWSDARVALAEAIAVMETADPAKIPFPYPNYLILLDPGVQSTTALAAAAHMHQGDGTTTTAYINLAMVNKKRADAQWNSTLGLLEPVLGAVSAAANAREAAPLRLLVRREALQEAVSSLDRALSQSPSTPGLLLSERGRLHLELGDDDHARADFARAVALTRESSESGPLSERGKRDWLSLAELHYKKGNWQEAIEASKYLLERAPDQLPAYRYKARAELELGQNTEARRTLEAYLQRAIGQGLDQVPREDLAEVYVTLGLLYAKERDYRRAADSYTQGVVLYGRGERGKLKPAERQALGQLYSLRGWAYLGVDVASLAGKDFEEALALDPRNVDAGLGKAESLVHLDKLAEAVAAADAARLLARTDRRVLFSAARVHAQAFAVAERGKRPAEVTPAEVAHWGDRAIDLLREALDQNPQDRAEFWKKYVADDSAFTPLRGQPRMRQLEQEATGTPR